MELLGPADATMTRLICMAEVHEPTTTRTERIQLYVHRNFQYNHHIQTAMLELFNPIGTFIFLFRSNFISGTRVYISLDHFFCSIGTSVGHSQLLYMEEGGNGDRCQSWHAKSIKLILKQELHYEAEPYLKTTCSKTIQQYKQKDMISCKDMKKLSH